MLHSQAAAPGNCSFVPKLQGCRAAAPEHAQSKPTGFHARVGSLCMSHNVDWLAAFHAACTASAIPTLPLHLYCQVTYIPTAYLPVLAAVVAKQSTRHQAVGTVCIRPSEHQTTCKLSYHRLANHQCWPIVTQTTITGHFSPSLSILRQFSRQFLVQSNCSSFTQLSNLKRLVGRYRTPFEAPTTFGKGLHAQVPLCAT